MKLERRLKRNKIELEQRLTRNRSEFFYKMRTEIETGGVPA